MCFPNIDNKAARVSGFHWLNTYRSMNNYCTVHYLFSDLQAKLNTSKKRISKRSSLLTFADWNEC